MHRPRCNIIQGTCEAPSAYSAHLYTARSSRCFSYSRSRAFRIASDTTTSGEGPQASDTVASTREEDAGTVEMYVALDEDLVAGNTNGSTNGAKPAARKSKSVRVKPPRNSPPQRLKVSSNAKEASSSQLTKHVNGDASKALQAELGMTAAELRAKSSDLETSKLQLKTKDRELALLRAAVAERDIRLRNAKSDLVSLRVAFQEKEGELQAAYQQLMTSAKERGEVRQQLLDTETELASTRSELEAWTQQASPSDKSQQGTKQPAPSSPASESEQVHDVARLLSELHSLSRRIADDAREDEMLFEDADLS